MHPELVVIGHILKEVIKFPTREFGPVLGGPAAYSCTVASRLGVRTGIVTVIGKDMPNKLLTPLHKTKMDITGLKILPRNITTSTELTYDRNGNKTLSFMKRAPKIKSEDIPITYRNAQIIYFCPIDYEVSIETARKTKYNSPDSIFAVDLQGYGGASSATHPNNRKDALAFLEELIGYFEIVKASIEDCRLLFRCDKTKIVFDILRNFGARITILTIGDEGAVVAENQKVWDIPVFPVNCSDPTGAGDAFAAGFLAEYIRTGKSRHSGLFASATASYLIEHSGGVDIERMPVYKEVIRRLKNQRTVESVKIKKSFRALELCPIEPILKVEKGID